MICRNCSYILSGSEQFCPQCGACVNRKEEKDISPPSIFTSDTKSEKNSARSEDNKIFLPPDSDTPEHALKKEKRKSKTTVFALSFLLLILCSVLAFILSSDELSPLISDVFSEKAEEINITQESSDTTSEKVSVSVDKSFSVVVPDISYKPVLCHLSGTKNLSIRRGPHNSYGQVDTVSEGEPVQILGGNALDDSWLYIYCPVKDCYGWCEGAYFSISETLSSPELSTAAATKEEP